jgi:trehalose-6-phosphate synthase
MRNGRKTAMVLELDLYHLTLQQISEFVRRKCSQYGTVLSVSVKLFPISTGQPRSFAVVEMASPEENTKLRDSIGDGYKDKGVLVDLLHTDR